MLHTETKSAAASPPSIEITATGRAILPDGLPPQTLHLLKTWSVFFADKRLILGIYRVEDIINFIEGILNERTQH